MMLTLRVKMLQAKAQKQVSAAHFKYINKNTKNQQYTMKIDEVINEGAIGAGAGAGLGALVGGPIGAVAGGALGNWLGNKLAGTPKVKAQKLRLQAQELLNLASQYDSMGNMKMPTWGGVRADSPMQDERFISSLQSIKGTDVEKIRAMIAAKAGIKESEFKPSGFAQNVASLAGKIAGAGTPVRQAFQAAKGPVLTPQEIQRFIFQLTQAEAKQLLQFFNSIHKSAAQPQAAPAAAAAPTTAPGASQPAAAPAAPTPGFLQSKIQGVREDMAYSKFLNRHL